MEITHWNINDYTSCKEIADSFSEATPSLEVFSELVRNVQVFVARQDWKVLWFVTYKLLWNESLFLQFLRVHKDYQRKWIARRLVERIEEVWREKWYYEIMSTILEGNIASKNFHEALWYKHSWEISFDSGKELVFLKEL